MTYTLYNPLDFLKKPYHSGNPYELSHTILGDLVECERKFEMNVMLNNPKALGDEWQASWHIRGTAYGAGIQAYLMTGDIEFAQLVCWLSYYPENEDLLRVPTISQARTLNNLFLSKDKLDAIRKRYTVAIFNGKPAIELSFKLTSQYGWYYIGHIDIVLYDTELNIYVVFEIKTTLAKYADLRPMYQNSGQGIGYSVALDTIVGEKLSQYGLLYLVCRDKNNSDFIPDIEVFPFKKNLVDRLRWFYTLQMDIERLEQMRTLGLFPMRGNACVSFGKTCQHFGFCNLTAGDVKKKEMQDNRIYDFQFNLEDVIQDHIGRIEHA